MPPPMTVLLAADLRPSANGSAVRTSLVAGSQRAYSLGWDRQTDRQTDGRIVVSHNARLYGGGQDQYFFIFFSWVV